MPSPDRLALARACRHAGMSLSQIGARLGGVTKQCVDQLLNRQKMLARLAVYKAVKTGRITRPAACTTCHRVGPVEAHHEDYSRRLDVAWLCRACHALAHVCYRKAA